MIAVILLCLLLPADLSAGYNGTRCKKPKVRERGEREQRAGYLLQGAEGETFTQDCTRFTCTKARGKYGIWADRPDT